MAKNMFEIKENNQVILIDDSLTNINCAKSKGYNIIHVSTNGYESFCKLV